MCALHIRWSTLVIHTALLWRGAIWQKLSNTWENAEGTSHKPAKHTDCWHQNTVTMCHIKKNIKNSTKIVYIKNIRYFQTKISDIYHIINDLYWRYISSQPWSVATFIIAYVTALDPWMSTWVDFSTLPLMLTFANISNQRVYFQTFETVSLINYSMHRCWQHTIVTA